MANDEASGPVVAEPMTDEELSDIEHGRVGCRCSRLLAEVKRLRAVEEQLLNDLDDEKMSQ